MRSNLAQTPSKSDYSASSMLSPDALMAANINPVTHLATDYLNHFNEVMMMLELLPTMPDMVGDVLSWSPKDYVSHFQNSGFIGKELAIAAYEIAPKAVKKPFEQTISEINAFLIEAQRKLLNIELDDELRVQLMVDETMATVQPLLGEADRLIHGRDLDFEGEDVADTQAEIDALFGLMDADLVELEADIAEEEATEAEQPAYIHIQNRKPRVRRFLRSRLKRLCI